MKHGLAKVKLNKATESCPEGEKHYLMKNPDVKEAIKRGIFTSGFMHYDLYGKDEGKPYICYEYKSTLNTNPTELCPEGEKEYARNNPDVTEAIKQGIYNTYFDHYQRYGKDEGKPYVCYSSNKSYSTNPTELCPEGEEEYSRNNPNVTKAIKEGIFETHFAHYQRYGKDEGKVYRCLVVNATS
eukprot:CAMPEP_0203661744 /NCGR_PEP_ID=MMETSP0088-20131115/59773_1 /ASSEMBLY_ACC=CAM_ASM_001087 /TAXON_ID=426623 /ORGANISM="Chaetoceros affinis, Strain CCMP159" /LENGTH=183 /DNA_ID=CAMNT_0050524433 /DNA_START=1 /DNA_END=552 /DNA_ORIENTATION=-